MSADPTMANMLAVWRQRMVEELAEREEGLSDGKKLIPGTVPVARSPIAEGVDAADVHLG